MAITTGAIIMTMIIVIMATITIDTTMVIITIMATIIMAGIHAAISAITRNMSANNPCHAASNSANAFGITAVNIVDM